MPTRTAPYYLAACLAGLVAALAAAPGLAAAALDSASPAFPPPRGAQDRPGSPAPAEVETGPVIVDQEAQREVALTVYNSDLALVKDIREVRLPTGLLQVQFRGVAERIDPTSVAVRSLLAQGAIAVVEQNYEFDLLTPEKLLEKFVGREVQLAVGGQLVPARLLAVNEGPIYEIDGKVYLSPPGSPVLPSVPDGLIPRPTLVWLLRNRDARPQRIETSYLTGGLSWRATYVVVLDEDDRRADVSGWVTLTNTSGTTYRNAALKLVAGEVHRAPKPDLRRIEALAAAPAADALAEASFREEGFLEYHLYTLEGRTTVKERQTKQVSLLSASGVEVARRLVFRGAPHYWQARLGTPIQNQKVGVFLEIENREARGLGLPLPKGVVRVFKADASGSLQLAGEDAIDHTPKDETVRIKLGEAFDVVGSRRQLDWKKVSDRVYEAEWEVHLRNHKTTPETVRVVEPVPGDWELLRSSHTPETPEAHTLRFEVRVPAGGEEKVTYRVRFRW